MLLNTENMKTKILQVIPIIALSLVLTACGRGGGNDTSNNVSTPVAVTGAIRMPKINYIASVSSGSVSINWQPTLDSNDLNLTTGVNYNIHASKTDNFTPSSSTLVKTQVKDLSINIDGLEVNQKYFFRVLAENKTEQSVSDIKSITISDKEIKLIDGVKAVESSTIKTSLKTIENGELNLDSSDNLKTGDIIVDKSTGIAVRLKSIDDSNTTATTEPANLGSIFDDIIIDSTVDVDLR